jgi:hypothetical protein
VEFKEKYPKIGLTVVDMASGWINCPEDPRTMTFDWVHPNSLGQKTMADKWFKAFKSIGDTQKPAFKAKLQVLAKTDSTATISWSPATDNNYVAGYDVLLDGKKVNWHKSGCGSTAKQCFALLQETQLQLTELKKGSTHTIELVAWDFANNSQKSEKSMITIP